MSAGQAGPTRRALAHTATFPRVPTQEGRVGAVGPFREEPDASCHHQGQPCYSCSSSPVSY